MQISIDVYCHVCGWDSSSAFVEAGGLDQLIFEHELRMEEIQDQELRRLVV